MSVGHPYGTKEGMASIPIGNDIQAEWDRVVPGLEDEMTVTLKAHQWAMVQAALRLAATMSQRPDLVALPHNAIQGQVDAHIHSQRT